MNIVIVGWIYEDELPENYPYDDMFELSKVDIVRMFPVYAPQSEKLNRKLFQEHLKSCSEEVAKWPEWKKQTGLLD